MKKVIRFSKSLLGSVAIALIATSTAMAEWTPAVSFGDADLTRCSFRFRIDGPSSIMYYNVDKAGYTVRSNTVPTQVKAGFSAPVNLDDLKSTLLPAKVISESTYKILETNYKGMAKHTPGFYPMGLTLNYSLSTTNSASASLLQLDYLANDNFITPSTYSAQTSTIKLEKNCK